MSVCLHQLAWAHHATQRYLSIFTFFNPKDNSFLFFLMSFLHPAHFLGVRVYITWPGSISRSTIRRRKAGLVKRKPNQPLLGFAWGPQRVPLSFPVCGVIRFLFLQIAKIILDSSRVASTRVQSWKLRQVCLIQLRWFTSWDGGSWLPVNCLIGSRY